MSMLWSWLVLSLSIWLAATLLPGFEIRGGWAIVKVAALFGILNWALGWLIFVVLGVVSLGIGFLLAFLTRWIVTALLLKLTDALSDSLKIRSFAHAFAGALVMSAVGTFAEFLIRR